MKQESHLATELLLELSHKLEMNLTECFPQSVGYMNHDSFSISRDINLPAKEHSINHSQNQIIKQNASNKHMKVISNGCSIFQIWRFGAQKMEKYYSSHCFKFKEIITPTIASNLKKLFGGDLFYSIFGAKHVRYLKLCIFEEMVGDEGF